MINKMIAAAALVVASTSAFATPMCDSKEVGEFVGAYAKLVDQAEVAAQSAIFFSQRANDPSLTENERFLAQQQFEYHFNAGMSAQNDAQKLTMEAYQVCGITNLPALR